MRRGGIALSAALLAAGVLGTGLAFASLAKLGPTVRVSTTAGDTDVTRLARTSSVAFNTRAGEYLVVWESEQVADGKLEIFGQRLSAAGEPLGPNFRISATGGDADASRDAVAPAVAYAYDANEFMVVWSGDPLASDGDNEIFGQRVAADGAPQGGNFRISTTGPEGELGRSADAPALAYSPVSRQYLVAWQGNALASLGKFEIFGQVLSAAGTPQGGNFRLSQTGADADPDRDATAADVAVSSLTGEWLIVWQGNGLPSAKTEIYGQRVDGSGAALGADFRITANGADDDAERTSVEPSVAYNAEAAEYFVTALANRLETTSAELEIYGQRLGGDGDLRGPSTRLSVTGVDGDTDRAPAQARVTSAGASGEYLVVWSADALATNEELEIFGQRVSWSGVLEGSNFRISTTGTDTDAGRDAVRPAVAFNPAGELLVSWDGDGLATPDELEVFAQRLDAADPPAPAPAPSATPAPPAPAPAATGEVLGSGPSPAIATRRARLNGSTIAIRLACNSGVRCLGSVRLRTAGKVRVARGTPRRTVTLGRASYSLAPGRAATIRVRIPAANRRLLRRLGRTRVRITVTSIGGTSSASRTVTVRA